METKTMELPSDIFEQNYQTFTATRLARRLEQKFAPRPYYLRFKTFRTVANFTSYCFNLFSALTAAILVYFFVLNLTGWIWLAVIATVIFLGLLEVSKRLIAREVFHDWMTKQTLNISMTAMAITLTVLSVSFSFFGSIRLVETLTTPAIQVNADSLIAPLRDRITALTLQMEDARKTTRRGVTTTTSQRTIETLTEQIAQLESEVIRINRTTEEKNDRVRSVHNAQTAGSAQNFAMVTLFLELLFLLCAWYLEYYDFRSYVEFQVVKQPVDETIKDSRKKLKTIGKQPLAQLQQNTDRGASPSKTELAKLKSQIATARYRLKKGIGKEETARKNLEKWTMVLSGIEG